MIKTFFIYVSGLCSSAFFFKSEVKEFASEINNFNVSNNKTNVMLDKLIEQQNKTQIEVQILDKKMDLSFANIRLGQQNIERLASSSSKNVNEGGFSWLFVCGLVSSGVLIGACLQAGIFSGSDTNVNECLKELKNTQGEDIKKIATYLVDFKHETSNEFSAIKRSSQYFFKDFTELKNEIQLQKFDVDLQNLKNNKVSSIQCVRHETVRR